MIAFGACTPKKNADNTQSQKGTWPNAVTYEIFVQSFCDSDGNGIGDFKGLTSKLPYIEELGVEAIWLMPIMPSPSYHKYDVTNYKAVHPDYGSLEDFREMLDEAHKRGVKVVVDFIINHTSKNHHWFKEASKGKDNPYRDYYVWKSLEEIKKQGNLTKESQADSDNKVQWYEVEDNSNQRYYGYFGSNMPDLNFDNPKVRKAIFEIGQYWLKDIGVDGFRLDAAKHIFDESPEKSHAFWVEFRKAMESVKPDVYLVGEVWADAKTVAPYLEGLPSLFNFDMGYAITDVCRNGADNGIVEKYKNIHDFYVSVTPDFIDATFITNHDQERIMSALNNDISKAKMAANLLMTFPGAPYVYYGEEIGMRGKKPDEYIREPFPWQKDGKGTPKWIKPKYTLSNTVAPASEQESDKNSMLNHYRALIHTRSKNKVLTFGEIKPVDFGSKEVVSFYRMHDSDTLMVIHNVSANELKLSNNLGEFKRQVFSTGKSISVENGDIQLSPYSTWIFSK
ncbi:alpha-amylase [Fulvitalea axinellae]|uniref:Alpha-amylase n=1 Tax=Fulvitalea axinellae TaxID=1182444 RepID=A0AAU9CP78_9BACT|nr:alpha-amylase [Fulvitalea axinellae]